MLAALAVTAPATAGAAPATDEYTLDLPSAGGSGSAPPPTPGGTVGAAGAPGAKGAGQSGLEPGVTAAEAAESARARELRFDIFHRGGELAANGRPASAVVADSLLDTGMLPIVMALALITGAGAWRILRSRRELPGNTA